MDDDTSGAYRLDSADAVITNKTFCGRVYLMYEGGGAWLCEDIGEGSSTDPGVTDGDCNQKGPRFSGPASGDRSNPGFQSSQNNNDFYMSYNLCVFDGAQGETDGDSGCGYNPAYNGTTECRRCEVPGCTCGGGSFLRNVSGLAPAGTSDVLWDEYRGNWLRREFCIDHNPQANAPLGQNGGNYLWGRVRETMVTGPTAGNFQWWGPSRGVTGRTPVHTGSNTRIFSTNLTLGDPCTKAGNECELFSSFVAFFEVSPADPLFWPGGAAEVEGAEAPSEPTGVLAWQP
jgi:hypothetical protein